jgi:hypothetical protein
VGLANFRPLSSVTKISTPFLLQRPPDLLVSVKAASPLAQAA